MQTRSSLIAGLAVVVWSGALALAQAPTPTPVASHIGVSSYAQSRGQSWMRHCSSTAATLCNTDADCPAGSCVGDSSVTCHTGADCAVCASHVCLSDDVTPCTKNANCLAGGCTGTPETCPDIGPVTCTTAGDEGCGGCYPAPLTRDALHTSDLPLVDPEWEPIGPMISGGPDSSLPAKSNPVTIHGTVALTKINVGSDFPGSHVGDDQNTFIQLDPVDNGILATGNSSDYECVPPGENCGLIEMELEFKKYPLFAWAGEGDRITAVGRWIFDCGHADPDPLGGCSYNSSKHCVTTSDCATCGGTCNTTTHKCSNKPTLSCTVDSDCNGWCSNNSAETCTVNEDCATCTNPEPTYNYRSELHPPQAIAVLRDKSIGKKPATQADILVTADAGGAGDICTVTHLASASDVLFKKNCFLNHCSKTTSRSCVTNTDCALGEQCLSFDQSLGGPITDINANDFVFDMPLPPTPAGVNTLKTSFQKFKPKGGIMPPKPILSTPTPGMLHVVVPMTTPASKKKPNNVFAGRLRAYWKEDTTKLTHVQVKFLSLAVNNPLKRATPVLKRVCTNPAGGLSPTDCSVSGNLDCSPGTCTKMNGIPTTKSCYTDKDCPKTQYCDSPSVCVGGIPPGWELFGEVNGDWVQLAGLKTKHTPDPLTTIGVADPFSSPPFSVPPTPFIIPLKKKTFDEYVRSDGKIQIASTGHSMGCVDLNLYGRNLKESLYTYGLLSGATCLNESDPDPGRLDVTHTGPNFVVAPPVNNLCTGAGAPFACCTGTRTGTCTPNSLCTGAGAPFACCSGIGTGTCTPDSLCTGAGAPFACCTGSGTGTCSSVTCIPPTKGTLYTCTTTPTDSGGGNCSTTTTRLCVEDEDCPTGQTCQSSPAWALTYTIQVK